MVIDDLSKFSLLSHDLKEQIVKAAIATVNIKAAVARKGAISNIKSNFVLRNDFTTRQVQFTPMPLGRYSLSQIQSTVGVNEKASYMERQEEGGKHTPSKGTTLAIPTYKARGGSDRNPVAVSWRVGNIKKDMRVHGESKRKYKNEHGSAWIVARAAVAHKRGLLLPTGGNEKQRNLHIVTDFHKSGDDVEFKTIQLYKFDKAETKTDSRPFLKPACEKVEKDGQAIFNGQMKKQGM
jgi:hypothetical protein